MSGIALRTLLLAALLVALGGCLSLDKPAPLSIYAPAFAVTVTSPGPASAWSLAVARPTADGLLATDAIAVRPDPVRLLGYKQVRWADTAPTLVQSALLRALEDSGRMAAVARPGSGLRSDHRLLLELRHFEAVYRAAKAAPVIRIEIQAKIIAVASGELLASKTFKQDRAANDKALPEVVAAFDAATAQALTDLVTWTLAAATVAPYDAPTE